MSESLLDAAKPVRSGEELDASAVFQWLREQGLDLTEPLRITQFPGGASNLTYLLESGERQLILRRPPFGHKAASAHDMAREYRIQDALKKAYPYVPPLVALCQDEAVLGCDFYVMERLKGIIPRKHMPRGLELTAEQNRQLCETVIGCLVELHRVDTSAPEIEALGRGEGYVRRQIEGWTRRMQGARTWNTPSWKGVCSWLADNMPDDVANVVIHGDFRFDNVVLDPEDPQRVIGVLDWEMATLGDPLMDLGNSLAYWTEAGDGFFAQSMRLQPTHLPGMLTRSEVVECYCERSGYRTDNWSFYEVYGLFRLAVIVQQIYYRYHRKETRNPRFKNFWAVNHYLHWRSRRAVRTGGR